MGFQFPLASVLQVRIRAEEREEVLLQNILLELSKAADSLRNLDAALSDAQQQRQVNLSASKTGFDLHALYEEVDKLKLRRLEIQTQIGKLEQLRDKQLIAYRAARQNREALAQLHERQLLEYQVGWDKREQKNLDDISSGRHVRKNARSAKRPASLKRVR